MFCNVFGTLEEPRLGRRAADGRFAAGQSALGEGGGDAVARHVRRGAAAPAPAARARPLSAAELQESRRGGRGVLSSCAHVAIHSLMARRLELPSIYVNLLEAFELVSK